SEKNIQIDGTATLFEDISSVDFQQLDEFFFTQNPDARKFKTDDSVFIVMKPTWYRLLDLTVLPPTEEEKTIEMAS
ncbi:MAG: hypothetical protein Q8Q49_02360, partial [bacterium]|nr:hypothetical protein [bacterium]